MVNFYCHFWTNCAGSCNQSPGGGGQIVAVDRHGAGGFPKC
jgi:hypothetical protein